MIFYLAYILASYLAVNLQFNRTFFWASYLAVYPQFYLTYILTFYLAVYGISPTIYLAVHPAFYLAFHLAVKAQRCPLGSGGPWLRPSGAHWGRELAVGV